jgi:hypothetical protein
MCSLSAMLISGATSLMVLCQAAVLLSRCDAAGYRHGDTVVSDVVVWVAIRPMGGYCVMR